MDLEEARKRVREAGLHASVRPERGWLVIARTVIPGEIAVLREVTVLQLEGGTWRFRRWEHAPGPGPDDVELVVPGFEEAVATVLRWYFGEPVRIGGWRIDAHKHPEWDVGKLERAVLGARPLPVSEWLRLQEEARATYVDLLSANIPKWREGGGPPEFPWETVLPLMFIPVRHPDPPRRTLWLRRDLEEAFIVEQ